MQQPEFRYPVWDPCRQALDVAWDWQFPQRTADAELALAQPVSVACVRVFYDQPWIFSYDPAVPDMDLARFDLVVVSDNEYYPVSQVRDWLASRGVNRYVLATAGRHHGQTLDPAREIYRSYVIKNFLRHSNAYEENLANEKPYMYDVLLGSRRPHRDYVMLALTRTGLLDSTITTYRSGFPGAIVDSMSQEAQKCFPGTQLNWPYVSPNLDPQWEVAENVQAYMSHVTPVEIYRRCWYSILCETLGTGQGFFLSEKTIKAMFNKRFFVMFGPQGYLANLQELGFSTFGAFVDESYDSEWRDTFRYRMAMAQVMRLAWFEDPADIYRGAEGILQRNHDRLKELMLCEQNSQRELLQQHISSEHWLY